MHTQLQLPGKKAILLLFVIITICIVPWFEREYAAFLVKRIAKNELEVLMGEGIDPPILVQNEIEPPEARDPNSPYFEMFHMNTYGKPNTFVNKSFKTDENWKQYFPDLQLALKLKSQDENQFGAASLLQYEVDMIQTKYASGNQFKAIIRPVTGNRTKINYGGAYFRARLIQNSKKDPISALANAIPCKVIDKGNGEYEVTAPLTMSGKFNLEVYHVVALAGIEAIIKEKEHPKSWDFGFAALTESGISMSCVMAFYHL